MSAVAGGANLVLRQVDVDVSTSEIPISTAPPNGFDRDGALVTADAMHDQPAHATYLVEQRRAHFLLTVKATNLKSGGSG